MTAKIQFTDEKYREMQQQLAALQKTEAEVLVRLTTAREMGDLSENGAYQYAKFELGRIRREMRELRHRLSIGEVMKPHVASGVVEIGSTVVIESATSKKTFLIVNEYEADPNQGRISNKSPIGKAIIGKRQGDEVTVDLPQGKVIWKVELVN